MRFLKKILATVAVMLSARLMAVWLFFPLPAVIVIRVFLALVILLAGLTLLDALTTQTATA